MSNRKPEGCPDEEKDRLVQWMSSDSPMPALKGDAVEKLATALRNLQKANISSACASIIPALADFTALDPEEAIFQMPTVAEHLKTCLACREEVVILREALSQHHSWLALAQALGGTSSHTLVVLIANAWHWLSESLAAPVRLRPEDLAFGRRLGEWMLLRQTGVVFALSRGQGTLSSLGLSIDVIPEARLHLVVTPEHIAATHQDIWRLSFELQDGALVDRIEIELLDQKKRSYGVRTVHPGKPAEFQVSPPADGGYSLLLAWTGTGRRETEREVDLPLRAGGAQDDG